jgi:hypothetical protein
VHGPYHFYDSKVSFIERYIQEQSYIVNNELISKETGELMDFGIFGDLLKETLELEPSQQQPTGTPKMRRAKSMLTKQQSSEKKKLPKKR